MKILPRLVCLLASCFGAAAALGQNLYLDFNKTDTFTHDFLQNSQGITLSWSATGGVEDVAGAAGGGVVSTGTGTVTAEHEGGPTFSLNDGFSYTVSEYVQVSSIGAQGDTVLALSLGAPARAAGANPRGIGVRLGNLDGTHLGVSLVYRDPATTQTTPVTLGTQPALGDWIKLSFTIQETDVATGAFTYSFRVDDLGTTGVATDANLLDFTSGNFTDNLLSATAAAGWVPLWESTIGGNAYDNLAAGPSGPEFGRLIVAKGDPAPGIANAVFSVIGNPTIGFDSNLAFQALVTGTGKDSGITAANNSGIWEYSLSNMPVLIARTGPGSAAAPDTNGGAFARLSDPLFCKNALGFYATLIPGLGDATPKTDAGVWTQNGGALSKYVRTGDPAPGLPSPAVIGAISQFGLNEDGAAPILGKASGAGVKASDSKCAWLPDSNGVLQLAYRQSQGFQAFVPQKLVGGQSRSLDPVNGYGTAILNFNKAFKAIGLAKPKGLATAGASGFAESFAVTGGTTAPGFSGADAPIIKSLGLPAVNSAGSIAFSFTMEHGGVKSSDNIGIALRPVQAAATASLLARTGSAAPGTAGALFSALSAPVLCNNSTVGAIGFIGSLTRGVGDTERNGSNSQGIWSDLTNTSGTVELIARQGDAAPGGGNFSRFEQMVLTDSPLIFFQALISDAPASTNQGIWYSAGPGQTYLVVRTGMLVQVGTTMKTIKSLEPFPIARYSMGQTRNFVPANSEFVYTAVFTDNSWAVFLLAFS